MLAAQGGVCAICKSNTSGRRRRDGSDSFFFVDHDHETKEVRGLLCSNRNTGLGIFQDKAHLLFRACRYLKPEVYKYDFG